MVVVFDQPFQILLELVQTHKLDPWDVDIEKLTDVLVQRIREIQKLDLRISGRTLLSAAILLHMKSRHLTGNGYGSEVSEELDDGIDLDMPELGPLMIVQRCPRKITLEEIITTLQETLREIPARKPRPRKKPEKIVHTLSEYQINIEEYLENFYEKIKQLASDGQSIELTELLSKKTRIELARALLVALFLNTQNKINLWQDEPLGEIHISLREQQEA
jgi:segregation and condensation protein A